MTVDSTNLLVALKQKPHPSDAGSEAVVDAARKERKGERNIQMKTRFRSLALVGVMAFCGGAAFGGAVKVAQTIKLVQGWNAVYITVAPDETADEIFGEWPVSKVGVYDPAAFLMTKQYSQSGSTEGAAASGFRMWYKDEPSLSQIKRIAANTVCACYATKDWEGMVYGRPSAPRITWHSSSTNETMNYVGFSLVADDTKVTLEKYFDGLDVGNVAYSYLLGGGDESHFALGPANGLTQFRNGDVVVMTASKLSDWSGVLNVSPMSGLDFSTNGTCRTLRVRNDSSKPRLVAFELGSGAAAQLGDVPPTLENGFLLRDETVLTNGWVQFSSSRPFQKEIAAGETLELTLALDRTKIPGTAGTYYGSILTIRDVSEKDCSHMRVSLPVEVTSDGGAASEHAWPKGLWLAAGELDAVSFVDQTTGGVDNTPVAAGGKMKVRLPLYVEADGTMQLLQRFTYGADADGRTHVYSARKDGDFPVAIGDAKRVSSSVLPIDEPVIGVYETTNVFEVVATNGTEVTTNEVTTVTTNGAFGTTATFAFTVSERSKVNPFRHAFHPSHDGLKWDFKTETPSGDDFHNYVSTVKPETFSVVNRVTFTWDGTNGAAWSPEERLSGFLAWELDGVRHEGAIRMTGRFTMRRISDATLDK